MCVYALLLLCSEGYGCYRFNKNILTGFIASSPPVSLVPGLSSNRRFAAKYDFIKDEDIQSVCFLSQTIIIIYYFPNMVFYFPCKRVYGTVSHVKNPLLLSSRYILSSIIVVYLSANLLFLSVAYSHVLSLSVNEQSAFIVIYITAILCYCYLVSTNVICVSEM